MLVVPRLEDIANVPAEQRQSAGAVASLLSEAADAVETLSDFAGKLPPEIGQRANYQPAQKRILMIHGPPHHRSYCHAHSFRPITEALVNPLSRFSTKHFQNLRNGLAVG